MDAVLQTLYTFQPFNIGCATAGSAPAAVIGGIESSNRRRGTAYQARGWRGSAESRWRRVGPQNLASMLVADPVGNPPPALEYLAAAVFRRPISRRALYLILVNAITDQFHRTGALEGIAARVQ
ncbi:hypothetical protein VTN96DRAFT_5867 [Rasamsonia emersonii]